MTGFGEIGRSDHFWAKMTIFDQKGEIKIFREEFFDHFF